MQTHTVESLGLDREELFSNWVADLETGRPLICDGDMIEAAQNRVAMRRIIRKAYPSLAPAVRTMGDEELNELANNVIDVAGGLV